MNIKSFYHQDNKCQVFHSVIRLGTWVSVYIVPYESEWLENVSPARNAPVADNIA